MIRHWTNTFVAVAEDCPACEGLVPVTKKEKKPAHLIQYELLSEHPYQYTFEEQLFEVYLRHKGLHSGLSPAERDALREELLGKSHPCMRASMLPKKYGWGVHYNEEGKIALYGVESEAYSAFVESAKAGPGIELQFAIRSKRAGKEGAK